MSDPVLVTAISGLFTLLTAVVAKNWRDSSKNAERLKSIEDDSVIIKEEVKNTHDTNLREDVDRIHLEAKYHHNELIKTLRGLNIDIGRLNDRDLLHHEKHLQIERKLSRIGEAVIDLERNVKQQNR